ncbi:predicted protein [Aspergillus terreus NIH2624]|uniref:Uncharacterized protein n=1 Tax=Aspergillus terreus (strain NIH 2624 / FGSC A1156) TaxID=341663 RepID=Q0CQX0_ASPTN|nr:uncharacterized protein ATEG_03914 [Aspergillus terreus NIH2624]EAU35716.1 predicted protein [Aspergillus terreus NIH2624]
MTTQKRRLWTEQEDRILHKESESQLIGAEGRVNDWNTIAAKLPGRTNKDCRKRWHKIGPNIRKGTWTAEEDGRLQEGVNTFGLRWTQVAEVVRTRNADQCSKRWRYALNPDVSHSPWTEEQDGTLLQRVAEYSHNWSKISTTTFRDRSTVDIKNRYFLLQRRQRDSTATSPKDLSSIDDESLPEISWTDAVPQQEQQDTALGGPVKSAPDQTATTTAMVDYQISRSTDLQGDYADLLVPCEDTMPVHTSDADYLQFLQNLDPALVVDELSQALDANASDDLHPTRPPTSSTAEPHNGSRLSTLTLEGLEPDTVNLVINTLLTSNSRFRMKLDNN